MTSDEAKEELPGVARKEEPATISHARKRRAYLVNNHGEQKGNELADAEERAARPRESLVALSAIPLGRGRGFLRVIGDTDAARFPFRPFWLEPMRFEDWADRPTKPETEKLCRELGVDVLFLVHVDGSPRGRLLREILEGKETTRGSHRRMAYPVP